MRKRSGSNPALAVGFGLALLAGVLVDWSPRYWRVTVAIACVSVVAAIWAVTARQIELPRQTILVALIAGWGPMQLILHSTLVSWPTVQRSVEWGMGAVCFVLGSQILRRQQSRDAFLTLILWAFTILAAAAMLQMYLSPGRVFGFIPVSDYVVGTVYYRNWFAAMMELAAPIALWQVYRGKLVAGGICYAAILAATISSASRMGVVLVLAEFLVALMLMVTGRRMRLKSALSLIGVLALLAVAAAGVAGTDALSKRLGEPDAYALRRTLLSSTLKMIPGHTWSGSGLGTWPSEYPAFATYDRGLFVNAAHNDWAQWASEGGGLFLLLMAVLVGWLAKPAVLSVWGMGALSVMIHSYVDYPLQDPSLAFLWFALAGALMQAATTPENKRSKED
jgi:O-antigen ligase